jgi:2-phospho-L-lactate guanylyltransferase
VALTPDVDWVVVVPVKPLARAKTRLAELPPERRADLALAMAGDTVAAALGAAAVGLVVVVTDDQRVSEALTARHGNSVLVVADAPKDGLNAAIRHGIAAAVENRPSAGIAVLLADLPALRAAELDAALAAAGPAEAIVVADLDGTGTTLLASRLPELLRPEFGTGSLRRHLEAGARVVQETGPGLRRDVDGLADLAAARALGVGVLTAALADTNRGPVPS